MKESDTHLIIIYHCGVCFVLQMAA